MSFSIDIFHNFGYNYLAKSIGKEVDVIGSYLSRKRGFNCKNTQ